MIWYDENLQVIEQPETVDVRLMGIYTPVEEQITTPAIIIKIEICVDSEVTTKILFSQTPKTLVHEEPTADELRAHYRHKLYTIRSKLLATKFSKL